MKTIRIIIICIFSLIILTPIVTFNFQENAISKNDNRMLAESPFSENVWGKQDFTKSVENYINDRIGLRDQMITAHTLLYDALFNNMIHPLYTNGTEGYIFGAGLTTPSVTYSSYHERFAYMVKAIQDYCIERNTPFLFVFNPAKPAVYSEFTPKGLNYSRKWVDQFLNKLDELGVRYIDNTKTLLSEKVREWITRILWYLWIL